MSSQNAVVSAQEVEVTTPVLTLVPPTTPTVCQPGDAECVKRWIEAFSDCD